VLVVLVWELVRPRLIGALVAVRERRALVEHRRGLLGIDRAASCAPAARTSPASLVRHARGWGDVPRPSASCAFGARARRLRVPYLSPADRRVRPQTVALLSEHCVAFPDESRPYGSSRLPDADDVLAKWLALSATSAR